MYFIFVGIRSPPIGRLLCSPPVGWAGYRIGLYNITPLHI